MILFLKVGKVAWVKVEKDHVKGPSLWRARVRNQIVAELNWRRECDIT